MSLASVTYTGTGSAQTLAIPFDYLSQSHIFVEVDGILQTLGVGYTFITASTIGITAADGAEIYIYRSTSPTVRLTNYIDGSPLPAAPLNIDSKQPFFLLQEIDDRLTGITTVVDGGGGDTIQTGITVADDGVGLGTVGTVKVLDFSGKGIEASRVGDQVTVEVTGSGNFTFDTSPPAIATVDDGHRYINSETFKRYVAVNDGTSRQWVEEIGGVIDYTDKADAAHTHTAADVVDLSEAIDDRVGALLVAGTGMAITYNDGANTLTLSSTGGGAGTYLPLAGGTMTGAIKLDDGYTGVSLIPDDTGWVRIKGNGAGGQSTIVVAEPNHPNNASEFQARAYDSEVQSGWDGSGYSISMSAGGGTSGALIHVNKYGSGSYSNYRNMYLGWGTATGLVTNGTGLSLFTNGTTGVFEGCTIGGSGKDGISGVALRVQGGINVVGSIYQNGSPLTTGANLSYTAATRVLASDTGTDATLPLVTSTDAGLAPASGGGTTNFLRADGTWAAPPGGGGGALDDLTDVVITTPSTGQVLKYNGTNWVNDTDATGGGGSVATDTIWNAKGDLAVGTGADTASILSAGTDGHVLTLDSSTATGVKWAAASGGSGTPGGSDTQIQFNDGGAFGGDADFTWSKTTNTLTHAASSSRIALKMDANDGTSTLFVPSTTNTAGLLGISPTGTGGSASIRFWPSSTYTSAHFAQIGATSNGMTIGTGHNGSGVSGNPIQFYNWDHAGATGLRYNGAMFSNGNWRFGRSALNTLLTDPGISFYVDSHAQFGSASSSVAVGLGRTPSSTWNACNALEIGQYVSMYALNSGYSGGLTSNMRYLTTTGWTYMSTAAANYLAVDNVGVYFGGANSGTVGTSVTLAGYLSILRNSGQPRFQADFSNGTFANRFMFQSSTTNGGTIVSAIPNGTGTSSGYYVSNSSGATNQGLAGLWIDSSAAYLTSTRGGSGTTLPIVVQLGDAQPQVARFQTNGNLNIGATTADFGYKLNVEGAFGVDGRIDVKGATTNMRIRGDMTNATLANRLTFVSSTTNGSSQLQVAPNGTSTDAGVAVFHDSAITNSGYIGFSHSSSEAAITASRIGSGTARAMVLKTGNTPTTALTLGTDQSATFAGNVAFTASTKLQGDFGNATPASRPTFQSNVTNNATWLQVQPNGTSTSSGLIAADNSTLTNAGFVTFFANGSVAGIQSGRFGTGTARDMVFYVNSAVNQAVRIFESTSNVNIGTSTTDPGVKLAVQGDAIRVTTAKTPASASAAGTTGDICWDSDYVYVCVATNTWKRTALSTW